MQLQRTASRLEPYIPLLLISCTTLFAFVVSLISLLSGWLTIFQNLFYIPIILACIYYTKRGFLFSVVLSCLYLGLMLLFSGDMAVIEGALIRVVIFIVVAAVITIVTVGRLHAEEALRESEARYSALFDNNYSVSLLIDPDTAGIVEANEAACRYYGYNHEQMLARAITDLNRLPRDNVVHDLQRAKNEGKKHFFSTHYLAGGERRDVEVYSGPITVQGRPLFYSIIHDVTDRKLAEEALRVSEKRYRDFFTTSRDSVFITTPEGRWIDFNDTALEMFGYRSREELMALPLPALYEHPEQRKDLLHLIATNNFVRDHPVRLRRQGGEIIDTLITSVPLRDKDGSITAFIGSIRDITEAKRAEEALRESEGRFRAIVEQSSDVVYITNDAGMITYISPMAVLVFGCTPGEMEGKQFSDFLRRDEVPRAIAAFQDAIRNGIRSTDFHLQMRRKDGSFFTGELRGALYASGGYSGTVGTIRDITERKQAEEALRMANRKLNLLGSITRHDILNQLLVVNGYLELLTEKVPDAGLELYITRVTTATARIEAMIRFTKEYEQVGVHAPAWQPVRDLVDAWAKDAVAGQVRVQNDLSPLTQIYADPLIAKVFHNLVDNAVRHGEKATMVRFSGEERDGAYVIACEDDGAGVPAAEKEKIFERGFGKHTGYGLFLAREILSITGITIAETGEEGKGAKFEIMVPRGGCRNRVRNGPADDGINQNRQEPAGGS